MDLLRALVLGLVQGLTEFIPISSSAHLVLVPSAFNWESPGLAFDTLLHLGTLLAVIIYFWQDWIGLAKGFFASLGRKGPWSTRQGGRLAEPESRLAWAIILGSIPAAVLGFLLEDFFEEIFDQPMAVGGFLLLTAVILALSERMTAKLNRLDRLNVPDALLIGLAQAAAIFPGISRSGATISAGLARGLTRDSAARFSFLLGTPVILGAGLLQLPDLVSENGLAFQLPTLAMGFLAAAVSGYLAIRFLLGYLRRGSLYVFAAYCAVLGVITILAFTF